MISDDLREGAYHKKSTKYSQQEQPELPTEAIASRRVNLIKQLKLPLPKKKPSTMIDMSPVITTKETVRDVHQYQRQIQSHKVE